MCYSLMFAPACRRSSSQNLMNNDDASRQRRTRRRRNVAAVLMVVCALALMLAHFSLLSSPGIGDDATPGPHDHSSNTPSPANAYDHSTISSTTLSDRTSNETSVAAAGRASVGQASGNAVARNISGLPAYLADFQPARRRRKYLDSEKPRSTLVSGFGDQCFTAQPAWQPFIQAARKRAQSHHGGAETSASDALPDHVPGQPTTEQPSKTVSTDDECLPDYNSTADARCIGDRRERVLTTLDANGWTIEVWYMAGRKGYLDITPHYLRGMLRDFGGVAARVVWLYQEEQASYIVPFAKKHYPDLVNAGLFELSVRGNIRRMYRRSITATRTLVLKFDDDTVFIEPHAVTTVFEELLRAESPCIVVSGNVVNHVGLNPVHALLGALDLERSAAASPRSYRAHQGGVHYDGYQRNVLGSYQQPLEWRQAHLDLLRSVRDGRLDRWYFPASSAVATGTLPTVTCRASLGSTVFDFQCDGMWRRWGINFLAFPALHSKHFGAMRDLGHLVKNKDEVYFTMEMGRHTASSSSSSSSGGGGRRRNRTCAVSDAVAVHFLNTGQASNVRRALNLSADGGPASADPRVHDASLLSPRLLDMYRDVAAHFGGVRRCCRSTGCRIYSPPKTNAAASLRPNDGNALDPLSPQHVFWLP